MTARMGPVVTSTTLAGSLEIAQSSKPFRNFDKVLHFVVNIRQLLLSYTSTGVHVGIRPAPPNSRQESVSSSFYGYKCTIVEQ